MRLEACQAALVALHEKYLDLILAGTDDDDQEVQMRLKQMLDQIAAQAEMKRALGSLTPQRRRKLAAFRKANPSLCRKVFSAKWSVRLEAVRSIVELEDPDTLAEPVLLLSLRHQNDDLAASGAHAACSGRYRSDAIIDALTGLLMRKASDSWDSFHSRPAQTSPYVTAAKALRQIKSKQAAPTIVALLCGKRFYSRDKMSLLTSVLIELDEKRALPHLIPLIGKRNVICTYSPDQPDEWTTTMGDMYLITVIRLTGQNHHVYGFKTSRFPTGLGGEYGFATQEKRSKAIQRFRKWWDANKDKPPYKNLESLKLPEMPKRKIPQWRLPEGLGLPEGIELPNRGRLLRRGATPRGIIGPRQGRTPKE